LDNIKPFLSRVDLNTKNIPNNQDLVAAQSDIISRGSDVWKSFIAESVSQIDVTRDKFFPILDDMINGTNGLYDLFSKALLPCNRLAEIESTLSTVQNSTTSLPDIAMTINGIHSTLKGFPDFAPMSRHRKTFRL
jgi:hypothetical protein